MKKQLAFCLALCLGVSVAGCGNSGSVETEAVTSKESTAKTTEAAADTQADSERVKIKVQSWQYALGNYKGFTEDADVANAIKEEFEATHPNIEVEVALMRQEDHFNALKVDFSAGTAPDVIGIVPGATLEQFKTQLEPLAPYAVNEWGEEWMDRFVEAGFTSVKMSGEEIYAFPSAMSAAGTLWVSDAQLKAGGVESIPKTWDELKAAAETLRANGSIPLMFGGQDAWQNYDMFITLMGSLNKDLTNQIFALEADWNDPDVIKAFDYYQRLFTEGIVQDGSLTTPIYNEGYSLWRDDNGDGSIPMIFNGSWDLGSLKSSNTYYETFAARGIQSALFPSIEGKDPVVLSAPDVTWAVNGSSAEKEAAWEFVKWLCDDMQQEVVDGLGFFSVLKDAPEITVETTEEFKKPYDVFAAAVASENTIGFRESFYADMSTALFDNLQLLATEAITPEEAAVAMDEVCAGLK